MVKIRRFCRGKSLFMMRFSDNDPKAIIADHTQALATPTEDNIQALAMVAGLKIKPVMTDGFVKKVLVVMSILFGVCQKMKV